MGNTNLYGLLFVSVVSLLIFNILLSKDIVDWVPSSKRKVGLILLVWVFPVIGFFLANRMSGLGWFSKKTSRGGQSVVAGGFMQADSVFNPGMKNCIEVFEKQKSEIHVGKDKEKHSKERSEDRCEE